MANNEFPEDWRDAPCFLVAIPEPLVPYVGGLLKIMEQRGFWTDADNYQRGYTATLELEGCLMATCLDVFIERQEDLYRLVNTALRGQVYTVVGETPLVVEPAIEHAVELGFIDQDSIFGQLDRLTQLIDNSINGTEVPLYAYDPSIKAMLQSIIDAIGAGTDLTEVLSDLEAIALLLA
jgi:hypothetical protein